MQAKASKTAAKSTTLLKNPLEIGFAESNFGYLLTDGIAEAFLAKAYR
jgi:hypothetical protein